MPFGSYESFLRKSLLKNIDPKDPFKILDKTNFKYLVRNFFKQYFVKQIYDSHDDQ